MEEQAPGSRAGLVTGGSLLAILVVLVAIIAGSDDAAPPPAGATTTTSWPVATATARTGPRLLDISKLPRAGLVVFNDDRDEVIFVSFDGLELARGPRGGWYPSDPDRGVDVDPSGTLTDGPALDDPLPGCEAVHGQGGVKVAVCGSSPSPTEIRVLSDGPARVLSGPVDGSGHWRYAVPSPDGQWVLGQWSGECEVPTAYLFPMTGGKGQPLIGREFATTAVGWAPDGRAVVGLWPGACSADTEEPGTYLLDPANGEHRRVHRFHQAVLASLGGYANRLERIMVRAIDELGLELCCNQPSHGGGDVEAGFVFEGHDIAVYGAPKDEVAGAAPPEPGALRFDCGTARYDLNDHGPVGSNAADRPDSSLLRRAATRLVTRLYCTPGPFETVR